MKLTQVRKFNDSVIYGYTYEDPTVYWSMKFYEECDRSVSLVEYIHNYRFVEFHAGIVL